MATTARYSDADLAYFEKIINLKLEKARQDLAVYKSSGTNANGTEDTSPTFKAIDEESSPTALKKERDDAISRLNKFISYLEEALVRVKNKSYGVCRKTGTLIPKERLIAVPHASLCIEMKAY
ncbi:MAG: TraR/DksA C4-type zinc finger protein [Candidatus Nomurabacteria bacterium]